MLDEHRELVAVERQNRVPERIDLSLAVNRVGHGSGNVEHEDNVGIDEIERGVAADLERHPLKAEHLHEDVGDGGFRGDPHDACFRLGDFRLEVFGPELAAGKVETEIVHARRNDIVIEFVEFHHAPGGQRCCVTRALQPAFGHIGAADINRATNHRNERDQGGGGKRKRIGFAIPAQTTQKAG